MHRNFQMTRATRYSLPGSLHYRLCIYNVNPFRTAVPFWGQSSQISSSFVPKRDCGSKGVNTEYLFMYEDIVHLLYVVVMFSACTINNKVRDLHEQLLTRTGYHAASMLRNCVQQFSFGTINATSTFMDYLVFQQRQVAIYQVPGRCVWPLLRLSFFLSVLPEHFSRLSELPLE